MAGDLRIGIVSDVHYGPPFEAKAGPRSLDLLRSALREIERTNPAMLVDLGDRINNAGRDADLRHMRAVAEVFATATVARQHVPGNHDVKSISVDENAEILGRPVGSRLVRCEGWDLVFWCADPRVTLEGFDVPPSDLVWLEEALSRTQGPTVVLSHVPLGGGAMVGNYYFEGSAAAGGAYANLAEIHGVLLQCPRLRLAIAGHVHWNSVHTVDGVPFLTVQSLSDVATSSPEPANAWATLDLGPTEARLAVAGQAPWSVRVPLRRDGQRWLVRPELAAQKAPRTTSVDLAMVDGVILDIDGVIHAGHQALPGAVAFIAGLRSSGRAIVAVTNHAGRSRADVVARLAGVGIVLGEHEVVTSIDAVTEYLRRFHPDAAVRAVGAPAMHEALAAAGFADGPEPDVVIAGFSDELDVRELTAAAEAILRGAAFLGANADLWLPRPGGARVPEAGAVLAYLTALTGRRPTVVGKPSATIAAMAFERLGLPPERVMWVGDTLETDVAGAIAAGAISALVLTGNTAPAERYWPRPDLVVPDLTALSEALEAAAADRAVGHGQRLG